MPDAIPPQIRSQRADTVRQLAAQMSRQFCQDFIGKTISVVLEHGRTDAQPAHGKWHFAVLLPPDSGKQGAEVMVQLMEYTKNGIKAKLI